MVSKKIDKTIVYKNFCLLNAYNNPDMLKTFSFLDIDIIN